MQSSGVLLVIVEPEARLPAWVGRCQDIVSDVVVLVAAAADDPLAFAERVVQRVNVIAESGEPIRFAVLVATDGDEPERTVSARQRICHALKPALSPAIEGQLLLLTDSRIGAGSRIELLSLAGSMAELFRGTQVAVSLRFGAADEADPPAELFLAPPPSEKRRSRRPPPKSGQMIKASVPPPSFAEEPLPLSRRGRDTTG